MQPEIIQKYNRPVPRYTSYPPANYFGEFSETDYLCAVNASDSARQNQISFYLHIPFCRHLCHYCGCNSYPAAKPETVEAYVGALHREIDLVARERDELVLVEVRARSCDRTQGAADTVGPEKLRRLVRAGRTYVALRGYDGFWRIDLVALDRTPSGWNLTHLRDLTAGRIEG